MPFNPDFVSAALAGLLLLATTASMADDGDRDRDYDERHRPASEFEFVTVIVEQNVTDGDTEIVIAAKPDSDNGLVTLDVRSPDGRKVARAKSPFSVGGMREFVFESPEPAGDAILAAYPEGEYRFNGTASDGERFRGMGTLSHHLPGATTILHPAQDAVVGSDALTIQWSQVPDAVQFLIEFENESVSPEQVFTVNVPTDVTSFEVPTSLLVPGADYQIAIASVGDSGNVVNVEVTFSTAE